MVWTVGLSGRRVYAPAAGGRVDSLIAVLEEGVARGRSLVEQNQEMRDRQRGLDLLARVMKEVSQ